MAEMFAGSMEQAFQAQQQNQRGRRMRARYVPGAIIQKGRVRSHAPWIKAEMKYIDDADTGYAVTTGAIHHLGTITHGDAYNQREGRKIAVVGIQMRGHILCGSTQASPVSYQWAVWKDLRPDGTTPTVAEVMTTDASAVRLPNVDGVGRYKCIKRQAGFIAGDSDDLTKCTSASMKIINTFIRFKKPLIVEYSASNTDGTWAGLNRNGLFLLMGGSGGAADSTTASFSFNCRLFFKDI